MSETPKINWYVCLDRLIDELCNSPVFEDDYGDPSLSRKKIGSNYPWVYVDFSKYRTDLQELSFINKRFTEFVGEFGGSIEEITINPCPNKLGIEIRVKMVYVENSANAKKALEG